MKPFKDRIFDILDSFCYPDNARAMTLCVCEYVDQLQSGDLIQDSFWCFIYRDLFKSVKHREHYDTVCTLIKFEIDCELEKLEITRQNTGETKVSTLLKLRYKRPRLWAALVFIPFVLITVIAFPVAVIYEYVCECPSYLFSFWQGVRTFFRETMSGFNESVGNGWVVWWDAVHGNRKLRDRVVLLGRQVGKTGVNTEMMQLSTTNLEDHYAHNR